MCTRYRPQPSYSSSVSVISAVGILKARQVWEGVLLVYVRALGGQV